MPSQIKYYLSSNLPLYLFFLLAFFTVTLMGQSNDTTEIPYDTVFVIRLHPTQPPLTVHITMPSCTGDNEGRTAYSVEFRDSLTGKLFQVVQDTSWPSMLADFDFLDANFDGFLDLRFVKYVDMAANTSFMFWLFDKRSNRFVYNHQFSELLVGEIALGWPSQTITSEARIGNDLYARRIYIVSADSLQLQEEFLDDLDEVNHQTVKVTKHTKRINGIMKAVK